MRILWHYYSSRQQVLTSTSVTCVAFFVIKYNYWKLLVSNTVGIWVQIWLLRTWPHSLRVEHFNTDALWQFCLSKKLLRKLPRSTRELPNLLHSFVNQGVVQENALDRQEVAGRKPRTGTVGGHQVISKVLEQDKVDYDLLVLRKFLPRKIK